MVTASRDSQFLDAEAFLRTDEMLARVYRRQNAGWIFESIGGREAELMPPSVGISLPLANLYEGIDPETE